MDWYTYVQQSYRHVDNIMFEDKKVVERFLEVWRKSGQQRIGHLYGKYEEYMDVPLGIRAVVSAIYEPPQVSIGQIYVTIAMHCMEGIVRI